MVCLCDRFKDIINTSSDDMLFMCIFLLQKIFNYYARESNGTTTYTTTYT